MRTHSFLIVTQSMALDHFGIPHHHTTVLQAQPHHTKYVWMGVKNKTCPKEGGCEFFSSWSSWNKTFWRGQLLTIFCQFPGLHWLLHSRWYVPVLYHSPSLLLLLAVVCTSSEAARQLRLLFGPMWFWTNWMARTKNNISHHLMICCWFYFIFLFQSGKQQNLCGGEWSAPHWNRTSGGRMGGAPPWCDRSKKILSRDNSQLGFQMIDLHKLGLFTFEMGYLMYDSIINSFFLATIRAARKIARPTQNVRPPSPAHSMASAGCTTTSLEGSTSSTMR